MVTPRRTPTPAKRAPAITTSDYLAKLPSDRQTELAIVLEVLRRHMPSGYRETVTSNMIVFEVPLARYADTYNGHPLWYVALASQKNHLSLHLMTVYGSIELMQKLRQGFAAAGKKLDIGKACVRFRKATDLPLELIAEIVASVPLERYVEIARAARQR